MQDALIGIDWGTSALRAYLMTRAGEIEDAIATGDGVLNVADGDFDRVFEETVGPWLARMDGVPVIASGMVGSRQGWMEAPYVSCPAGVSELAAKLTPVRTQRGTSVWLVPGIKHIDANAIPDVARGEETQIVGSLDPDGGADRVTVLPGTHTKWALVRGGRIVSFTTFMTGEVFAVLSQHSILGRLMEGSADDAQAYRRGLELAAHEAGGTGGLLRRLFSVRTLGLFDELAKTGLRSYLSGLLIGSEMLEAKGILGAELDGTVRILGSPGLAALYLEAARFFGMRCESGRQDAAALGLARIAARAELYRGGA